MTCGLRMMGKRIEIKITKHIERFRLGHRACVRPHGVSVLEAADLIWQETAAVSEQNPQVLQFVQRAAEHQLADHDRAVERITDKVGQVIAVEPPAGTLRIGMREYDDF